MASVTLKNIPDDLLDVLRSASQRDRRSLNQEIIYLLGASLHSRSEVPAARAPEVEAQLAAWRKLAGKWKSDVTPETESARITSRRTPGRKVDL